MATQCRGTKTKRINRHKLAVIQAVLVEYDSAFALLFQSEANGHYDLRKPSEYAGISQRSQTGRVAYVLRLDSHPPLWFALEGRCG